MKTRIFIATTVVVPLLLFVIEPNDGQSQDTDTNTKHENVSGEENLRVFNPFEEDPNNRQLFFNETDLTFTYYNSVRGNDKPIKIEYGNEKEVIDQWLQNTPLKFITHGWLTENHNLAFDIKTAYLATGNYNVITLDWHRIANNLIYPIPAYYSTRVGKIVAKYLERFVELEVINSSEIHLIGHSLGAHVVGECGHVFRLGKIGRITGLDPALPGFEFFPLQTHHLDASDAQFVDVIHTSAGTLGYIESIGTVDFRPNGGISPQPGCADMLVISELQGCSHFRSIDLYTESVYHKKSFLSTKCNSWKEYEIGLCKNNTKSPMGSDADPKARGDYYLRTNAHSPYSIEEN